MSNIAGGCDGRQHILVKVQDSQGQPVEGADFTIKNDVLVHRLSRSPLRRS